MSRSSMAMVHMHINVTEEKAKYKRLQSCTKHSFAHEDRK